jgi:hypothetical protein
MGTKLAKVAFLVAAMMFFAVLALDITVPAVVLTLMALSNWFVLSTGTTIHQHRRGAA